MTIDVRTSPSGPLVQVPEAVPFRNLTSVAYVDNGAPPPTTPDGNIESPWTTFNAANVANPTVIYVAPGNYLGEGIVSFIPPGCTVYGMGDAPRSVVPFDTLRCPLLPDLDFSPPPGINEFFFENVRVTVAGASAFVFSITFRNCFVVSTEGSNYITFLEGGSFSGDAGGQGIYARNCDIPLGVDLTAAAAGNRFENCTITTGANFTFDVAGGVLQVDCATLASMHLATSTVVNGGVSVLDGPAITYAYGAGAANNNDFFAPYGQVGAAVAAVTSQWMPTSGGRRWAHRIQVQLQAVAAADMTLTVWVGATIAGLAATALTVTVTAGQTEASFDLTTSIVEVLAGSYISVRYTSAAALVTACKVIVGIS